MERCIGEPAGGTGSAAIVLAAAPQQPQPLLGIPVPNGQIPARRQHPVLASTGKVWINKPPIEAEPILAPPLIQAARVAAKECHFSWQRGRMA
jgi:hypothetical protein